MKFLCKYLNNKKVITIILIIISLISVNSIFINKGITYGHDIYFHLSRIEGILDNIRLGKLSSIYPYYLYQYGYGNNFFYPDFFLYIPAILRYIGLSKVVSYNIFLYLITLLSIITMYISVNGFTNNKKAALISSIIYSASSYRLTDLFYRSAIGEALSFIFVPLIIYGIYEIINKDYKKFYILTIGMSGLILSHLLSTLIVVILLIIICLINIKKFDKNRLKYLIIAALITILLTAFFTFPMIEQMLDGEFLYKNLTYDVSLRTQPLYALFLEFPFYKYKTPWFPIGIGSVFLYSIILFIKNYKNLSKFTKELYILGILFLVSGTSIFPWNIFKNILGMLQFPWRLFLISTSLFTIAIGLMINDLKKIIKFKQLIILLILSMFPLIVYTYMFYDTYTIELNNYKDLTFEEYSHDNDHYYISNEEYLPIETNSKYIYERKEKILTKDEMTFEYTRNNLNFIVKFTNNNTNNTMEFPLIYYKGYNALVNGQKVDVYKSNNGFVQINVDNVCSGVINLYYENTNIKKICNYISLITLILFILFVINKYTYLIKLKK